MALKLGGIFIETSWNSFDKFVAWFRYHKVMKKVPDDGVIVDIGCDREAAFLNRVSSKISKGYGMDFRIKNKNIGNLILFILHTN